MTDSSVALAVLTGLALRLAVPILVTAMAVYALRKLDARWQAEARSMPLRVEKPKCWKAHGCPPAKRKLCPGFKSPYPCWQVFRRQSGYLDQKCLGCSVFVQAPVPVRS